MKTAIFTIWFRAEIIIRRITSCWIFLCPKINGFHIILMLKGRDAVKDIPIIFITTLTTPDNKVNLSHLLATEKQMEVTRRLLNFHSRVDDTRIR